MTFIEEVHFVDGAFELDACPLGAFHLEGEIIGNIYQTPDLLE